MSILDDFGVRLGITVHMRSDAKKQEGSVDYQFGVAKMPTKDEVDAAIRECLTAFNSQLGVEDARITHLGDQGFARDHRLEWQFSSPSHPGGEPK